MALRAFLSVLAVLIGLSGAAAGAAYAEPSPPSPTITSTDDELTDMVLDAIGHGAGTPTTTPVPALPR